MGFARPRPSLQGGAQAELSESQQARINQSCQRSSEGLGYGLLIAGFWLCLYSEIGLA